MTMEDETILAKSPDNACAVLTEAGMEYNAVKTNQDSFYIDKDNMVFAVFDGHGKNGHLCARFCCDAMSAALSAETDKGKVPMTNKSLCAVLVRVDDKLKADGGIDCRYSGTTVTCCAVTKDTVISAWLGDSRAIMGRWSDTQISLVELSLDHKPENPKERRRILKAGGRIRQIVDEDGNKAGGLRVFVPSKDIPGVAFTRSVGDEIIHAYGVSSDVDCIVHPRTLQDRFMVIASDGIFEFIPNEEVLELVSSCATVEAAAEKLIKTAKKRWIDAEESSDDCTVIVIKMQTQALQS